jgi:hypothetical protein
VFYSIELPCSAKRVSNSQDDRDARRRQELRGRRRPGGRIEERRNSQQALPGKINEWCDTISGDKKRTDLYTGLSDVDRDDFTHLALVKTVGGGAATRDNRCKVVVVRKRTFEAPSDFVTCCGK